MHQQGFLSQIIFIDGQPSLFSHTEVLDQIISRIIPTRQNDKSFDDDAFVQRAKNIKFVFQSGGRKTESGKLEPNPVILHKGFRKFLNSKLVNICLIKYESRMLHKCLNNIQTSYS